MSHEEKIHFMKIAAGICGYGFSYQQLDLLVSLYEFVCSTEGQGSVKDVLAVEQAVKKRVEIQERSELLDKFSEQV